MMAQQILAVFLVLGLLLGTLYFLRRPGIAAHVVSASRMLGQAPRTKRLKVLEHVVLTPHHSLHLVAFDEQIALLATSPTSCQRVDTERGAQSDTSFESGAAC